MCVRRQNLAVGDGVEHLADFSGSVHLLLWAGERVRGCQGVHSKHLVDVIQ